MNNLIKLDKNKIINLVNIYNVMLTVKQLLILIGYNFNELYIDKFWNNIEDDEWIYLDDELIIWLGYKEISKGKEKIVKFLKDLFIIDIDYNIYTNDEFFKLNFISPAAGGITYRYNFKHILINSTSFKKLCLKVGTNKSEKILNYYMDLEKIFKFYILYQSKYQELKSAHELENHKLQLQEAENILKLKDLKLEEEINKNKILHNQIITTKLLEFYDYIYIITTKNYANESIFKIGYTANMYTRLTNYNTGVVGDNNKFYYCYYFKCHDAKALESTIFGLLKNFKIKNEMYQINFEYLCQILDFIQKGNYNNVNMINKFISNDYQNSLSKEIIIPNEIVFQKNYKDNEVEPEVEQEVEEEIQQKIQQEVEQEIEEVEEVEEIEEGINIKKLTNVENKNNISKSVLFLYELINETFKHKDFKIHLNEYIYSTENLYQIYLVYCEKRKIQYFCKRMFMKKLKLINLNTIKKNKINSYKFTIQSIKENIKAYLNDPKIFIREIINLVEKEPLYIFIKEKYIYKEGNYIKLSKFKDDYNLWLNQSKYIHKLNYTLFLEINDKFIIKKKKKFCKSCNKIAKVECCSSYNIKNRYTVNIIENIGYI